MQHKTKCNSPMNSKKTFLLVAKDTPILVSGPIPCSCPHSRPCHNECFSICKFDCTFDCVLAYSFYVMVHCWRPVPVPWTEVQRTVKPLHVVLSQPQMPRLHEIHILTRPANPVVPKLGGAEVLQGGAPLG